MGDRKPGLHRVLTCTLAALALSPLQACDSPTMVQQLPAIQTNLPWYPFYVSIQSVRVSIGYVFTNHTGSAAYLVNCDGQVGWRLERKVGDAWETAWAPAQRECLSPPIVVPPRASRPGTLFIELGIVPWTAAPPEFDVSGPFRVVWSGVLSSIDPRQYPIGPEVPEMYRVSNTFRMSFP